MADILRPIIETAVIFPGLFLAYLPMKQHLRISKRKLAAIGIPCLILFCIICGSFCWLFRINALWLFIPILSAVCAVYHLTLKINFWKAISIILAVCGVFACLASVSKAFDSMLAPDNPDPWFCLGAAIIYNVMCWGFVALSFYPATHAAYNLLEDEGIAQTWYIFWILPSVFIAINFFMIPLNPNILFQGRIMQGYIVISLTFLSLLILFYVLFYLMAKSLNRNNALKQENQFLSMQQSQYERLCTAIEETKQARHDMRHHFSALSTLADKKEWQELKSYLDSAVENIPNAELNLCDNQAVDGVAGHYCIRYKENDIPYSIEIDLPQMLPISEIDICVVIANLLENALEASLRTDKPRRFVKMKTYLYSDNVVLITVENNFDGIINVHNGIFQSSKRHGDGVGLQSIRRIAEKNGGYCNFTRTENTFCADVMLRGKTDIQ